MLKAIKAEAVKAGTVVAERSGATFTVATVEAVGRASVRFTFERGPWIVPVAPVTVRRASLVNVIEFEN